jgi:hypothetical protein
MDCIHCYWRFHRMVKKMVYSETVSGNFVFVLDFLGPCVIKVLSERVDGLAILVGF